MTSKRPLFSLLAKSTRTPLPGNSAKPVENEQGSELPGAGDQRPLVVFDVARVSTRSLCIRDLQRDGRLAADRGPLTVRKGRRAVDAGRDDRAALFAALDREAFQAELDVVQCPVHLTFRSRDEVCIHCAGLGGKEAR